ncbi:MAG: DNA repair protein RadC [bacterium]|nr:DNA repair protein RadC [bacterium]
MNREILEKQISLLGAGALTDLELASLIVGGSRGADNQTVIEEFLTELDATGGDRFPPKLLKTRKTAGPRIYTAMATYELARRRLSQRGVKIRSPEDVMQVVRHLADRPQEHFICLSLSGAHEVIAVRVVTIGLVNATQVHPREVFSDPLKDRATAIIIAHNHPSGELEPSRQDLEATRMIANAGKVLGIGLVDHVIFSHRGYVSLKEKGLYREG